jgi:hypothetical protein
MFQLTGWQRRLWILGLLAAIVWYPVLTWLLGFTPRTRLDFGLAFNSMAEHLLVGRFDVDPEVIGAEGFDIGDRTVAYFGIFCALLRIPLVLLPGFSRTDVTWYSCLIAAWLGVWFQMCAVAQIWRAPATARQNWLAVGLLISIVLGGQHIQFLRPSIYQEPIDWACAQAMAFVFLAIRGIVTVRGFDRSTLCWMAVCAGLALLTRVSFGIGLYASLGLLLLASGQPRLWPAPGFILLAFIVMTGIVNQGRWGNPLTFADFSHYDLAQDVYPDRLGRLVAYGTFNTDRIWLGLDYYFLPLWTWIRGDGHVLFAESQATLMDAMELPPDSFLLTDPLLLGLAVAGIWSVRDRVSAALLLGLSVPPALMLCAISMAHRYRMEFYPLLFFAALLCLAAPSGIGPTTKRFRTATIVSVVIGIASAHAMAVLDARSPRGPAEFYLERYGLVGTYTRPQQ